MDRCALDDPLHHALPDPDRSGIDDILQTLHQHAQHIATSSVDDGTRRSLPPADVSVGSTQQVSEERLLRQWTKDQLVLEVIRLRTSLRVLGKPVEAVRPPQHDLPSGSKGMSEVDAVRKGQGTSAVASGINTGLPPLSARPSPRIAGRPPSGSPSDVQDQPVEPTKRKRVDTAVKSEATGKRLEAPRRTELTKALRAKIGFTRFLPFSTRSCAVDEGLDGCQR